MIKGLLLALQFLTRLPINIMIDWNEENLRKSSFFFPFVGMLLGLISYGVYYIFSHINTNIGGVFTVLALIVLTGGLHLDGLSDTCDGFFSNKDKEAMLDIMKDSRVGAFGVISLIIALLLKYVLIASLGENALLFLVFSLGNSRAVQVYNLATTKPARSSGIGYIFRSSRPERLAILGIGVYLILAASVNLGIILVFLLNFFAMKLVASYSYKKIDGTSGDVFGAMAELGELVSLLGFLGVSRWILF